MLCRLPRRGNAATLRAREATIEVTEVVDCWLAPDHHAGIRATEICEASHRLIAFDGERVTFRWKDYTHNGQRGTMTLTAMEFLRRFVQHVLPRGFVRIRQFGYLANTCRTARLTLARRLLQITPPPAKAPPTAATWCCPQCGATMIIGPILTGRQLVRAGLGFDAS